MQKFVRKLSNKFPAKDITDDDIKYKLKLITKKKKKNNCHKQKFKF